MKKYNQPELELNLYTSDVLLASGVTEPEQIIAGDNFKDDIFDIIK